MIWLLICLTFVSGDKPPLQTTIAQYKTKIECEQEAAKLNGPYIAHEYFCGVKP